MLKLTRAMFALSLAVALAACNTVPVYEGVSFIKPPEDISTAWIGEDGHLYMVPEKGVVVDAVTNERGEDVAWRAVGAYLSVDRAGYEDGSKIWLTIEGKKRLVHVPRAYSSK